MELLNTQALSDAAFVFDLNADSNTEDAKNVKVGDVFYVRGRENRTTGYVWKVATDETCSDAITYSTDYQTDQYPTKFMGVKNFVVLGSTVTFKFKVGESATPGKICQIGLSSF